MKTAKIYLKFKNMYYLILRFIYFFYRYFYLCMDSVEMLLISGFQLLKK